jgi:hypothetical protein
MKLPSLAGELLALFLLWRYAGRPVAAIYALSPVAILISSFHGNTDSLCESLTDPVERGDHIKR